MADADTETADPGPDTPSEDRIVDRVVSKVLEALHSRDTAAGDGAKDEPESVAAQVRAAVAQIRQDEADQRTAQEAADDRTRTMIAEAVPEKRPREYRKSTERMGWVTEADR
jgi:hypothetical protein